MISNFIQMLSGLVFELLGGLISILPESTINLDTVNGMWAAVPGAGTIANWVSYFFPTSYMTIALTTWITAMLAFVIARSVISAARN